MYLQLTTRCNMTCAHCCFSADRSGSDMSIETFKKALKFSNEWGSYLVLGGGEPTVHPQFMDFLGLAIVHNPEPEFPILVVTNGKRKDIALKLAELAKQGLVQAELSVDMFHDAISDEVLKAFEPAERHYSESSHSRDFRGIRSVRRIVPVGRAIETGAAAEREGCCCETLLIDPAGAIWACGCKTIQLGTIWSPEIPEDYTPEWAHSEEAQTFLEERQELAACA